MRLSRRAVVGTVPAVWLATAGLTGCSSGEKVPVPDQPWTGATALTDAEDGPMGLAVDGGDVYFTTGGSQVGENAVRVVPLDGSAPSRIVSTKDDDFVPSEAIGVADGVAYVASGSEIWTVEIATGATTRLVASRPGTVRGLAVAEGHLWWTTSQLNVPSAAECARMPLGGGPVEILAAGIETEKAPYVVDVAERRAVTVPDLTSMSDIVAIGDGAEVACPLGLLRVLPGTRPDLYLRTDTPVGALALDNGGTAYFLVVGKRTSLRSYRSVTGSDIVDLEADLDDTGSLAVVGDHVVGVVRRGLGSGDSSIVAVPLAGGPAVTLSSGRYVGGAVAAGGAAGPVVFVGDDRVWTVPLS